MNSDLFSRAKHLSGILPRSQSHSSYRPYSTIVPPCPPPCQTVTGPKSKSKSDDDVHHKKSTVHAEWLGTVPYMDALKIQKQQVKLVRHSHRTGESIDRKNRLYFLEHTPVYTTGIRTSDYSEHEADRLKKLGADFIRSERGGLITFHGPGQLVVYPVVDLRDLRTHECNVFGVRVYVQTVERLVIRVLREQFGLEAGIICGLHGVWLGNSKIAAVGIKVSHGVCSHGLAINCNVDLGWFDHIVPCGIKDKLVTSVSAMTGNDVRPQHLIRPICDAFGDMFGCDVDVQAIKHL